MQLASKIDNNQYNTDDLVEVKFRLNLPYMTSTAEYENLSGEININGQHHNYVKRKISQDTLYLLCLPNTQKDKLSNAAGKYAATSNDFDGNHKNENGVKKSISFSQYKEEHETFALGAPVAIMNQFTTFSSIHLPDSFVETAGKPPRSDS